MQTGTTVVAGGATGPAAVGGGGAGAGGVGPEMGASSYQGNQTNQYYAPTANSAYSKTGDNIMGHASSVLINELKVDLYSLRLCNL